MSTQNVSGIAGQMAEPLKIPAANIRVHQDHVGGGFGSKFGPDRWGIITAKLSKKAGGKPVRMMLERDSELKVAGARPSAYARVKVGAKKDGTLVAWESRSWGTGGPGGGGMPPIPYCFAVPNQHKEHTAIRNNIGPARAWRAPNHPQAAVLTMCALEDVAAKLNMDPYEFFLKNIELTKLPQVYREEFPIAAELMGWKEKWHPRGQNISNGIARGVGLSIHTWGGRGHASDCDLSIHPDGSVDIKMGTQDIGTGTRTCIAVVAADALGLKVGRHQTVHRRHAVSAVGWVGRVHHAGRRQFVHAARSCRCSRRLVRESRARAERAAGRSRRERRQDQPEVRSGQVASAGRKLARRSARRQSPPTATTIRRLRRTSPTSPTAVWAACRWRKSLSTPRPASSKSRRWSPCRIAASSST